MRHAGVPPKARDFLTKQVIAWMEKIGSYGPWGRYCYHLEDGRTAKEYLQTIVGGARYLELQVSDGSIFKWEE